MMTAGFVVCFQFNQLSCFLGVAHEQIGLKVQMLLYFL